MKIKLNAWAIVTEMNVWAAMKRTKMIWTIVHVEKIVLARTKKNSYSNIKNLSFDLIYEIWMF